MANTNFPTMDQAAIEQQQDDVKAKREQAAENKQNQEDRFKNYLSTVIPKDEDEKVLTIRLLPSSKDAKTPFEQLYSHMVRVPKGAYEGKDWKRFICAYRNDSTKTIDDCPFCQTADAAFKAMKETSSESEKERLKEIAKANRAQEMWAIRCIERGHEDDGVKFWIFNHQFGGDGIYDKIMDLQRDWADEHKNQPGASIFDLNNGCDLKIRIKRGDKNKYVYRITLTNEDTPLTDNVEKGMAWINDEKTWRDVFKVRPYDEMAIIVKGGIPVWDKDEKRFYEKTEYEARRAGQPTPQQVEDNSYQQLQNGTYQTAAPAPAAAPVAQPAAPVAQPASNAFPSLGAPDASAPGSNYDLPF